MHEQKSRVPCPPLWVGMERTETHDDSSQTPKQEICQLSGHACPPKAVGMAPGVMGRGSLRASSRLRNNVNLIISANKVKHGRPIHRAESVRRINALLERKWNRQWMVDKRMV